MPTGHWDRQLRFVYRFHRRLCMSSNSSTSTSTTATTTSTTSTTTVVRPVAVRVVANTLERCEIEAADADSEAALAQAVDLLRHDDVVAFPTETVYGLGANALHAAAATKIFAAKARPADNPLIVHVATLAQLAAVAQVPEAAWPVIRRFWPGPLTLLLPRHTHDDAARGTFAVPDAVTCGQPTVGVRMPAHPVARLLIQRCGLPIAAPSANRSGRPSPTRAAHVAADLGSGRIPLIIDGGPAHVGVESTVVDLLSQPPALLRPGGVTYEQLAPLLPGLRVYAKHFRSAALEAAPTTPGMKYRHYAPDARLVLVDPDRFDSDAAVPALRRAVDRLVADLVARATPFAVVRTHPLHGGTGGSASSAALQPYLPGTTAHQLRHPLALEYTLSATGAPDDAAHDLFNALRTLDDLGVRVIIAEALPETHAGLAVMNRLRKAASETIAVDVAEGDGGSSGSL